MKNYRILVVLALVLAAFQATMARAQEAETKQNEKSLTALTPVEGEYYARRERNVTISGRVFPLAILHNVGTNGNGYASQKAVYLNPGDYDRFETWVGVRGGITRGKFRFTVQGDGQTLFASRWMEPSDAPVRVNVSVKGYSGVALFAEGEGVGWNSSGTAVWANPIFTRSSIVIPQLLSPQNHARLNRNTQLMWEGVEEASSYLLELQAVELYSPVSSKLNERFIVMEYPGDKTSFNESQGVALRTTPKNSHTFYVNESPRGKWRWRVHALSPTGIIGEMTEWRYFTSQ